MITSLPASKTNSILYQLCQQNPHLAHVIQTAHQENLMAKVAAEATKPAINFDSYSRNCWHALNKEHKGSQSSEQDIAALDVSNELDDARLAIMACAGKGTRWETRRNALEVLRKISKSVMLCEIQLIQHELMKDGMLLGTFANSMLQLAKGMSELERKRYRDEGLYEKLWQLQDECDDIDMEGLQKVYAIFDGQEVEEDEEADVTQSEEDGLEDPGHDGESG